MLRPLIQAVLLPPRTANTHGIPTSATDARLPPTTSNIHPHPHPVPLLGTLRRARPLCASPRSGAPMLERAAAWFLLAAWILAALLWAGSTRSSRAHVPHTRCRGTAPGVGHRLKVSSVLQESCLGEAGCRPSPTCAWELGLVGVTTAALNWPRAIRLAGHRRCAVAPPRLLVSKAAKRCKNCHLRRL